MEWFYLFNNLFLKVKKLSDRTVSVPLVSFSGQEGFEYDYFMGYFSLLMRF